MRFSPSNYFLGLTLCTLLATGPAAAADIDPSVIDPVGKLREISASVARSSKELEKVGDELDKLNKDLDGLDKKSQNDKKLTQKDFLVLEHKYHQTIDRSEAIEKQVTSALGQNLKDIENVRTVLKQIAADRSKNKNSKHILSDGDLQECLQNLGELETTVKQLQASLKDEEEDFDQNQNQNQNKNQNKKAGKVKAKADAKPKAKKKG